MSELNPQQREAVRDIENPLLVLAGAGSGKTRVITHKIAYLLQKCDYQGKDIIAVTFTNKAAREMQSRIKQMLEKKTYRGLRISTFHTLGLDILKHNPTLYNLKSGFSIFDSQDSLSLLRKLIHSDNNKEADLLNSIQQTISRWKNELLSPAQAESTAQDKHELFISAIYKKYEKSLRTYNAVDFDDLILLPVQGLRTNAELMEHWQTKLRYILIDEYQDTNACQYELMKLLVGVRERFTVVGDDDQSVYSWRGARPENLISLKQDYPTLRLIKLEQNYRSMGRILKAANHLISVNPHIFEKKLWSEKGYGDPIRVIGCKDEIDEAQQVISEIISHQFQHRTKYCEYAILYRGNHQAKLFEKLLRDHRIPYKVSGGLSFFERSEIKDILSYLRLIINPDDDNAYLRIVNTPRRGIGNSTLEKVSLFAGKNGLSLFDASCALALSLEISAAAWKKIQIFVDWINHIRDECQNGDPNASIRQMIIDMEYETWLYESSDNTELADRRMKNVYDFIGWIQQSLEKSESEDKLKDVINKLILMEILKNNDDDSADNNVQLMTLHAAKGLEFPHVYMVGVEDQILPHHSSIDANNLEEERRLAYVGVTRAQKTLTITFAKQRTRFGEKVACVPSRFLEELPQDDLVWSGRSSDTAPPDKNKGTAHLASLLSILKTDVDKN